jgi:hypothetical protein
LVGIEDLEEVDDPSSAVVDGGDGGESADAAFEGSDAEA